jgi:hypothetical protein
MLIQFEYEVGMLNAKYGDRKYKGDLTMGGSGLSINSYFLSSQGNCLALSILFCHGGATPVWEQKVMAGSRRCSRQGRGLEKNSLNMDD